MSESNKFTPGPWILETVQTSSGICHKIGPFPWKDGKQNHACIYADYPGTGAIEKELVANAHLIAAAPDLLEALEGVLRISDLWLPHEVEEQHAEEMYVLHMARNKMIAAVEKARGQQ